VENVKLKSAKKTDKTALERNTAKLRTLQPTGRRKYTYSQATYFQVTAEGREARNVLCHVFHATNALRQTEPAPRRPRRQWHEPVWVLNIRRLPPLHRDRPVVEATQPG